MGILKWLGSEKHFIFMPLLMHMSAAISWLGTLCYTRKNAQAVTCLQASCYNAVQQAVTVMCSHWLFPVC